MKIDNFKFGKEGIKYEIVKSILIYKLIDKYKDKKYWVQIFPELEYETNVLCSVYFIDLKTGKEVIYQITDYIKGEDFKDFKGKVIRISLRNKGDSITKIEKEIEEILE